MADQELLLKLDELEQLTVVKLKEELKERGLATSGTKPVLVQRLTDYLKSANAELPSNDASLDGTDDDVLKEASAALEKSNVVAKKKIEAPGTTETATAVKSKPAVTAVKPAVTTTEKTDTENGAPKPMSAMTEAEKRIERAKKFGCDLTGEDKKALRAERFGTTVPSVSSGTGKATITANKPVVDAEMLKKRAERFGIPVNEQSPDAKKIARASRFGSTEIDSAKSVSLAAVKPTSAEQDALLQKRKARFGEVVPAASEVDEKKAKRAARFAS